jgi:hypothetical protein
VIVLSKVEIVQMLSLRKFPKKILPVLSILYDHIDRIEFTKSHIGLNNYIFIAEGNTSYDFPYYAYFNLKSFDTRNPHYNHFVEVFSYLDVEVIKSELIRFLKETNDTLFVEIGFNESYQTQKDNFHVFFELENNNQLDLLKTVASHKDYPAWYDTKSPEEILNERLYQKLEIIQRFLIQKQIKELSEQIDVSLMNRDRESFERLTKRYRLLINDLT